MRFFFSTRVKRAQISYSRRVHDVKLGRGHEDWDQQIQFFTTPCVLWDTIQDGGQNKIGKFKILCLFDVASFKLVSLWTYIRQLQWDMCSCQVCCCFMDINFVKMSVEWSLLSMIAGRWSLKSIEIYVMIELGNPCKKNFVTLNLTYTCIYWLKVTHRFNCEFFSIIFHCIIFIFSVANNQAILLVTALRAVGFGTYIIN